jgi:prepilin-type N-terminal cleavage/methylation domain-containing protein
MKRLAAGGATLRAPRGFTLIEATITLGILAVLVALAVFGLSSATRQARLSGAKFTFLSTLNMARQRAMARGADVYVIVSNLDSTTNWPPSDAARVLVYEDLNLQLRTLPPDVMAVVDANPGSVREEFNAAGDTFGSSGFAFVNLGSGAVGACSAAEMAQLPPYVSVTGSRATTTPCARAWCTFCRQEAGRCIGLIRFNADGQARLITEPTNTGTGGLIKLVNPTDATRSACIAIGEPSGVAIIL